MQVGLEADVVGLEGDAEEDDWVRDWSGGTDV